VSIVCLSGPGLLELSAAPAGGVYLLQSQTDLSLYRIGESKNLLTRARTHAVGRAQSRSKAPNWTEVFRPWNYVWVAAIPSATHIGLKMCEHHLFSVFAQRFVFVDDSGFEAHPDAQEALATIASAELETLQAIATLQHRPKFDKNAHWAGLT
jgi:predicted GIY-YIG superfamily endonuclease